MPVDRHPGPAPSASTSPPRRRLSADHPPPGRKQGSGKRWSAAGQPTSRISAFCLPPRYTRNRSTGSQEFSSDPVTFRRHPPNLLLSVSHRDANGEVIMKHQLLAASALTTAVGLALAMQAPTARAHGMA